MNLFNGRTSRTVFFLSLVCLNLLIVFGYNFILFLSLSASRINNLLPMVVALMGIITLFFLIVVEVALHARRWHDLGKSGWFSVLSLIPVLGIFITVVLFFIPGEKQKNKYGMKPVAIRF